ncbi:MAG: exosortase A, partial [Novosphingobium sp.]
MPLEWRSALVRLSGVWAALILVFAGDWTAMFRQWWDSSTYNHILLVPAILGWLVWLRLDQLRRLTPQAWAPGLVLVAGAVLLWVLGAFAGFDLLRQTGAVAVLPASLLTLLGPRVGAGLFFPLCYMAFLVPFGDELVPALQMITAVLTIALVQISGIPALVDGVFIDTPAGLFEVAEACSGVKFLIAMIALGVLVANVCFQSWKRRIAFLALCIVVPILANAVRAWGTIYIAQYIGAEKAAGFDHIIYGWLFFAIVIAAVLGVSWRWFDRAVDD